MNSKNSKKAFTLVEIIITLAVVGVISAVTVPFAIKATPDENTKKFNKANATLNGVLAELLSTNKYYDGSLKYYPNGEKVDSATYLCETMADVMSVKRQNCSSEEIDIDKGHLSLGRVDGVDNTQAEKEYADLMCAEFPREEIVASDNVTYYEVDPGHHFGTEKITEYGERADLYGKDGFWNNCNPQENRNCEARQSFDLAYKIFCFDVDGINNKEAPFGYGIRADGKILTGARADAWLLKNAQGAQGAQRN